jgi:hypothetical protein
MSQNQRISLKLTAEQKEAIKAATGKDAEAIELTAEELEERIAPSRIFHKLTS